MLTTGRILTEDEATDELMELVGTDAAPEPDDEELTPEELAAMQKSAKEFAELREKYGNAATFARRSALYDLLMKKKHDSETAGIAPALTWQPTWTGIDPGKDYSASYGQTATLS